MWTIWWITSSASSTQVCIKHVSETGSRDGEIKMFRREEKGYVFRWSVGTEMRHDD